MFKLSEITQEVRAIAERETVPVIALSIDKIADELEKKHGRRPSKSMIWAALRAIGAVAKGRKFIYRSNPPRYE